MLVTPLHDPRFVTEARMPPFQNQALQKAHERGNEDIWMSYSPGSRDNSGALVIANFAERRARGASETE